MTIQTEDIYRCLLRSTADGVVISDALGAVVDCSDAFVQLVGKTAIDEVIGAPLTSFVDLESSEAHAEAWKGPAIADGAGKIGKAKASKNDKGTSKAEDKPATQKPGGSIASPRLAVIRTSSGADLMMPVSHIPIGDADGNGAGKKSGFLTIVYIVQAHSVQQAQTEFVSTVSHELRTPLTSIKGFADTILRAGDRLDSSQQRRYVGIIKDQADRLTRLVEDLLAVSRLEGKKLQLTIRAINLEEVVYRVTRNLQDKARDHKIVVSLPPGLAPVWADADRLEQILTNLIDNAIKYSPSNTTVTFTAKGIQETPEKVEFSVSDQGVGIPSEHLPEIFSKFSRLDNPLVRQTEGTGLGLYITRSLVLALGGQIKVTSTPGQTTFTVQLPAATLEQQAARGLG